MTSVLYPTRSIRKQAIALLPTLSGKHRARHAFTPFYTEVIVIRKEHTIINFISVTETKHLLSYEKMGPPISTIDKGYHREFLIKRDISSSRVVT